jgi:hypothetical protein
MTTNDGPSCIIPMGGEEEDVGVSNQPHPVTGNKRPRSTGSRDQQQPSNLQGALYQKVPKIRSFMGNLMKAAQRDKGRILLFTHTGASQQQERSVQIQCIGMSKHLTDAHKKALAVFLGQVCGDSFMEREVALKFLDCAPTPRKYAPWTFDVCPVTVFTVLQMLKRRKVITANLYSEIVRNYKDSINDSEERLYAKYADAQSTLHEFLANKAADAARSGHQQGAATMTAGGGLSGPTAAAHVAGQTGGQPVGVVQLPACRGTTGQGSFVVQAGTAQQGSIVQLEAPMRPERIESGMNVNSEDDCDGPGSEAVIGAAQQRLEALREHVQHLEQRVASRMPSAAEVPGPPSVAHHPAAVTVAVTAAQPVGEAQSSGVLTDALGLAQQERQVEGNNHAADGTTGDSLANALLSAVQIDQALETVARNHSEGVQGGLSIDAPRQSLMGSTGWRVSGEVTEATAAGPSSAVPALHDHEAGSSQLPGASGSTGLRPGSAALGTRTDAPLHVVSNADIPANHPAGMGIDANDYAVGIGTGDQLTQPTSEQQQTRRNPRKAAGALMGALLHHEKSK